METISQTVRDGKTLGDFLGEREGLHQQYRSDLPVIILAIAKSVRRIALILSLGKLADLTSTTAVPNPFGEATKKIDALAHQAFFEELFSTDKVAFIFSEEKKLPDVGAHRAEYLVFIDPLDGSSLVSYNGTTGSIFSIYRRKGGWRFKRESGLPELDLKDQVFAGYGLYGAATLLVFVLGGIVFEFVLDRFSSCRDSCHLNIQEFVLADEGIRIPVGGKIYSINEAYSESWPVGLMAYINELKKRGYSSRYVGSLVADFHRTLKEGGVFLYPATARNPNGKLRLFYEAGPMAYIIQAAEGVAIDCRVPHRDILYVKGTSATQTTPLVLGSPLEIATLGRFLNQSNKM